MGTAPLPSVEDIMQLLRGVIDPELGSNIVELGMAKGASVADSGLVRLDIALTTLGCPLRSQIKNDAVARVAALPGVREVVVDWTELNDDEKAETMSVARRNAADRAGATAIPPTTKVLAIASGKGGVGKSSLTVNLAVALATNGRNVAIIDADIWGFSVPRMLGIEGKLDAAPIGDGKTQIMPHSLKMGAGRLDVVSMGFLVDGEESALLWRGLMLNRAVQHFLEDVAWNDDLDYLVIDMPPGTGDVAMGLARMLPRAEIYVVTTPAVAAQKVAARAVTMARKCHQRVAGIIENMATYVDSDGGHHDIFGTGGGQALAASTGVPLVASIPIEPAVSQGGDDGEPAVLGDGPAAKAIRELANLIVEELSPPVEMESCTARLFDLVDAALDAHDNEG